MRLLPDLNPDTMLALQTIEFRGDWEQIYEDVVLAEPDVFVEVLRSFRDGDGHAFEYLWPDITAPASWCFVTGCGYECVDA